MNRFEYSNCELLNNEAIVDSVSPVRLYDGDKRTGFDNGELTLTTHRLFWGEIGEFSKRNQCFTMPLCLVVYIEEETAQAGAFGIFGGGRSFKLILHLDKPSIDRNPGPIPTSQYDFIKIAFKRNYEEIVRKITQTIGDRKWEKTAKQLTVIKTRTGIGGIEKHLEETQKTTNADITVAFQDLKKLMSTAKNMVNLSKQISQKIREKQNDFTEDETVIFRKYLMSFGIDDPVTRNSYKTNYEYFRDLALEINDLLMQTLDESDSGGMVTLTDAYCKINRARGLHLVSPEDILNACSMFQEMPQISICLNKFDSGVYVVQLKSMNEESIVQSVTEIINEKESISADELAQQTGISVILAKERLLMCERVGVAVRDETIESLRFFKNLFLSID